MCVFKFTSLVYNDDLPERGTLINTRFISVYFFSELRIDLVTV